MSSFDSKVTQMEKIDMQGNKSKPRTSKEVIA
jgi:hypothetical protein